MRRLSKQTQLVLLALLRAPGDWKYGYGLSQETGLKSGSLYPILVRLAERKLVETSWETVQAGRPPRHLYRLTSAGEQLARECELPPRVRSARRAAFSG